MYLLDYLEKRKWYVILALCVVILAIVWMLEARHIDQPDFWTFIKDRKDVLELPRHTRQICERKNEKKCREIIERIFQCPFPTVRPEFLKYPLTGKNLELDMYNDNLHLAVEYQGIQHRKYTPYYHKVYSDFIRQQERDSFKHQRCRDMGITLILVPDTVKTEKLEEFIRQKVSEVQQNEK
jgi:hypothetical protein